MTLLTKLKLYKLKKDILDYLGNYEYETPEIVIDFKIQSINKKDGIVDVYEHYRFSDKISSDEWVAWRYTEYNQPLYNLLVEYYDLTK